MAEYEKYIDQGYKAAHRGISRTACPYDNKSRKWPSRREAWLEGWDMAVQLHRDRALFVIQQHLCLEECKEENL
jgi:ribosome modulation factor